MADLPQRVRCAALRGYSQRPGRPQALFSPRWMLALLLWPLLAFAPAAHADPVVVTTGDYTPDIEGHMFRLVGNGFDLFQNEPFFFPEWTSHICNPCRPGNVVDFSSRFEGESYFGSGSGTIDGTRHPALTYQGTLDFRAMPVVFPPEESAEPGSSNSLVVVQAPFQFTGSLAAFADGRLVFERSLTGAGTAGAAYFGEPGGPRLLEDSQPAFRFEAAEPVPEPATLVLVAAGAAVAAARRRRRSRTGC